MQGMIKDKYISWSQEFAYYTFKVLTVGPKYAFVDRINDFFDERSSVKILKFCLGVVWPRSHNLYLQIWKTLQLWSGS